MPESSNPSDTPAPSSWDEATEQEFQQLVRLTGSRTQALQLHRSTEPDSQKGLDRLLTPSEFPTFQETEEQLQEQFDDQQAQDIARLTLVLQHAGLQEDRDNDRLFEGFSQRERQLKTRRQREEDTLSKIRQGEATGKPADIENELNIIELQLDDLYRQAQLCLEIQAMREEYNQITQGQALSNENILEAVAHRGETRMEEIQDGIQDRRPLAQLAAVERAAEEATVSTGRGSRSGQNPTPSTPQQDRSGPRR